MKKLWIFLFFLVLLQFPALIFAQEEPPRVEIPSQMAESMQNADPDFDFEQCVEDIQNNTFSFDTMWLLKTVGNVFLKEIRACLKIIAALLTIGVLFSVISSMGVQEKKGGIFDIAYYVCLLVLFGLIIAAFLTASKNAREIVESMCVFLKSVLLILFTYLAAAGSYISAGSFSATFLVVAQLLNDIILNVIFPLSMITLALCLINTLYEKPVLSSLINLFKSASKYILSFMFIVFLGMASLQGALSSTFENISTKSAKFVAKSIPVVGSMLSDSVDVMLSSSAVIKNSIGVAGILTLIASVLVPALQLTAIILIFKAGGALMEVVAGEKFSRCLSQSADALCMLLGGVLCVFVFSVAAIGVIVSVGNAVLAR